MTLIVLLIALVALRGLGALGLRRFATWPAVAAHALAIMLVMTASAHFAPASVTVMPTHDDLVGMVPPAVPFPSAMVYLTGVLEFLGAVGLIIPWTRRAAGYCLALLFVVMLPANIYAATANVTLAGDPVSPLWRRIPEQILYIAVALWATRGASTLTLRADDTKVASTLER